jgi:hypothetical protein
VRVFLIRRDGMSHKCDPEDSRIRTEPSRDFGPGDYGNSTPVEEAGCLVRATHQNHDQLVRLLGLVEGTKGSIWLRGIFRSWQKWTRLKKWYKAEPGS